MNLEQLFSLLNQYEEFNFTLWNIYIAVTLAVLGYAIGGDKIRRLAPRVVLAAAFVAFSLGNANYLERNAVLINAAAAEIEYITVENSDLSEEFDKAISRWSDMQPESLRFGHYIIDAIVVFLILFGPQLIHGFNQNRTREQPDA
tara:strand:- start:13214 stop:13648 length:435 start_codon:yes stop_codon:yes gene_type:complete